MALNRNSNPWKWLKMDPFKEVGNAKDIDSHHNVIGALVVQNRHMFSFLPLFGAVSNSLDRPCLSSNQSNPESFAEVFEGDSCHGKQGERCSFWNIDTCTNQILSCLQNNIVPKASARCSSFNVFLCLSVNFTCWFFYIAFWMNNCVAFHARLICFFFAKVLWQYVAA